MTASIKLALSPSPCSHTQKSLLPPLPGVMAEELLSVLRRPLPPPAVDLGASQHRCVAGEAASMSPGLQVSAGEKLPLPIANFHARDGCGLLDRWPMAPELSECTYVCSDREFQL